MDVAQEPKKHALVSYWKKKEDYDTYFCYRIIRIDRPLFLIPQTEGVEMKLLLHVGQNKEIFYFTRNPNPKNSTGEDITFNILNNLAVVNKVGLKA
jgi:hypothetical protein